jgi:hypothetical protein
LNIRLRRPSKAITNEYLRSDFFSPAFKEMLYKTIRKESKEKYITHRLSRARKMKLKKQ